MAASLKDTLKQISLLKKEKIKSYNQINNLKEMNQTIIKVTQEKNNELGPKKEKKKKTTC